MFGVWQRRAVPVRAATALILRLRPSGIRGCIQRLYVAALEFMAMASSCRGFRVSHVMKGHWGRSAAVYTVASSMLLLLLWTYTHTCSGDPATPKPSAGVVCQLQLPTSHPQRCAAKERPVPAFSHCRLQTAATATAVLAFEPGGCFVAFAFAWVSGARCPCAAALSPCPCSISAHVEAEAGPGP